MNRAPTRPDQITVAIVEDDDELRSELSEFFARSEGFELLNAVADSESALAELPLSKPDVVLMDINLPGMDGIECVRQLKKLIPQTQIMMLTVYEDNERLFRSLAAGATGYLLKRSSAREILQAVRDLHQGGSPITPQIARLLVQHCKTAASGSSVYPELSTLSEHQLAFLDQLAQGYRYKEIADNLGISMEGVRSYVRRIYEKLQVHSRTEAVLKYLSRSP